MIPGVTRRVNIEQDELFVKKLPFGYILPYVWAAQARDLGPGAISDRVRIWVGACRGCCARSGAALRALPGSGCAASFRCGWNGDWALVRHRGCAPSPFMRAASLSHLRAWPGCVD